MKVFVDPERKFMLLTISTEHKPATDLGFLLHKHPERFQSFDLGFGQAHVFYPDASDDVCKVSLLLEVDPIGMVRGKKQEQNFLLGQYVNDRPYVASSFMSVAIAHVFGSALSGRCKDRPELVATALPLTATIDVLPVRGGEDLLHRMFEPLGYEVSAVRKPLDEQFPEWGQSSYFSVSIRGTQTLSELLTHLYVLIPVFDNEKHYFVGEDELEKLLSKGGSWLATHPDKEQITRRYLKHRSVLVHVALERLKSDNGEATEEAGGQGEIADSALMPTLASLRYESVLSELRECGAQSIIDLGCGEGKLLKELLNEWQFGTIVGMDVSIRSLEFAQKRLKLDRLPEHQAARLKLLHGSLIYRDKRLEGFDAATVIEVIEHLDPPRLSAFERVVFEFAQPKTVVLTTPNREYNVMWESLPAGQFRHADHRFEWTRQEFEEWATRVAQQYGYSVRFHGIGPEDKTNGCPTQMGVFERNKN